MLDGKYFKFNFTVSQSLMKNVGVETNSYLIFLVGFVIFNRIVFNYFILLYCRVI